jgi:hypothetical protein
MFPKPMSRTDHPGMTLCLHTVPHCIVLWLAGRDVRTYFRSLLSTRFGFLASQQQRNPCHRHQVSVNEQRPFMVLLEDNDVLLSACKLLAQK